MNRLKILLLLIMCVVICRTHSQSIDSINYKLDNVIYTHLTDFDYHTSVKLPDSTVKKVINVLNGYLPPDVVDNVKTFNDKTMRNIEKECKELCGNDTLCFISAKDSIINSNIAHQLRNLRTYSFPQNFILAIGNWNIQDAVPILLKNLNNDRYPMRETLLALAKLGNDSIYNIVNKKYTLQFVVNNSVLKDNNPDLIYKQIPIGERIGDQISFFYQAGMYLKNKQIILNIIDLLDVQGKVYAFDELIPIEEETLMWLGTRFMTKELLQNGEYDKWESIINDYLYQIMDFKNTDRIKYILSKEKKEKIKTQLKDWIKENVTFE
jgi:hypothetical protein